MKSHQVLLTLTALSTIAPSSYAIFGVGDISYDPAVHSSILAFQSSQLAQWAQAIAKYEDQISKQIEQIQRTKDLVNGQSALLASIGDWQKVYDKAQSIRLQSKELTRDFGASHSVTTYVNYGQPTLAWNNKGRYNSVATATRHGTEVKMNDTDLKRYRTIDQLYEDLNKSIDESETVMKELLVEIAATAEAMAKAPNEAETVKLQNKMQGLKIALDNARAKRDAKLDRFKVEVEVNRAQQEKEAYAAAQVLAAEQKEDATRALQYSTSSK